MTTLPTGRRPARHCPPTVAAPDLTELGRKIRQYDNKFEAIYDLLRTVAGEIITLNTKFDARFDTLSTRVDELGTKFDALDNTNADAGFKELEITQLQILELLRGRDSPEPRSAVGCLGARPIRPSGRDSSPDCYPARVRDRLIPGRAVGGSFRIWLARRGARRALCPAGLIPVGTRSSTRSRQLDRRAPGRRREAGRRRCRTALSDLRADR